MSLRLITAFIILMLLVIGVGLVFVGVAVFGSSMGGGIVGFVVGCLLVLYATHITLGARHDRYPRWIRDLAGVPI